LNLRKKKSEFEKAVEPKSLNPNPMVKESQLALIIALPFLAGVIGIYIAAKNYMIQPEEFGLLVAVVFIIWFAGLIGFYSYSMGEAVKHILFDREFGFTERLHPRCEIYCMPEDIRLLISPNDKIKNFDGLKKRIESMGFEGQVQEKIINMLGNCNFAKYVYYFRHKHTFEGWNGTEHTRPQFRSHIVFTDKPFDEQFGFAAGQENWWGPIIFNHPSAESDNVKVLWWSLDPFTSEPMPWCLLIHSSLRYARQEKQEEEGDFKVTDAAMLIIAKYHAISETLRKKVTNKGALLEAKFAGHENIVKLAHDGAKADIQLFQIAMKDISRGWLKSGWFKAVVTIFSIAAIVFLICYILGWIDISSILG
jgi:hypothetical protein